MSTIRNWVLVLGTATAALLVTGTPAMAEVDPDSGTSLVVPGEAVAEETPTATDAAVPTGDAGADDPEPGADPDDTSAPAAEPQPVPTVTEPAIEEPVASVLVDVLDTAKTTPPLTAAGGVLPSTAALTGENVLSSTDDTPMVPAETASTGDTVPSSDPVADAAVVDQVIDDLLPAHAVVVTSGTDIPQLSSTGTPTQKLLPVGLLSIGVGLIILLIAGRLDRRATRH